MIGQHDSHPRRSDQPSARLIRRGVFERVGPALGTIIGSNIAAALILGATKWLMG
jgi:hypothetical protein